MPMLFDDPLSVLDGLSLIFEDLDINNVEGKLVDLVNEAFHFDRVALFFVKHKKNVLQGKLSTGFHPEAITDVSIPLDETSMLTMPLITGAPLWGRERDPTDPLATRLGVSNYVVVPIINKKRVNCWEETQCGNADCPAYGKKLVRCWEMPELDCKECEARQGHCPVFRHQNIETMEGVILADNTPSGNFIQREAVTALTIITHAVGLAINNSKNYKRAVSDSVRDPLTLLHNRRFFNEHILDEIDRSNRYNDPFSLIMCDIDHFKNVNDKYGHPFGDQVLMWVAKMLREKCRRTDVVARYGGEEFTILLTNADKAEAARVAEHLRRAFDETPFLHEDAELKITLSFGAASFPADADTSESLIRLADKALYLAKEAGRNRIHVA